MHAMLSALVIDTSRPTQLNAQSPLNGSRFITPVVKSALAEKESLMRAGRTEEAGAPNRPT